MSKLTHDFRAADKANTQLAKEFAVGTATIAKIKRKAAQPKPHGSVEISLEGDSVVLRLPK